MRTDWNFDDVTFPFDRAEALRLAELYDAKNRSREEEALADALRRSAQRGHMTRDDLVQIARWKWRGGATRKLVKRNTEEEVRAITAASFASSCERLRLGVLRSLEGVDWPMASVILHFAFPTRYPVLDVRALGTLGLPIKYHQQNWEGYAEACRGKAQELGISLRTLDKALWTKHRLRTPGAEAASRW